MTIEYTECTSSFFRLTSLPRLVQTTPRALIRRQENKVEFLERQFHKEKLSFVRKKETEHSFEFSLSICVFYRCIFNLQIQNFSLENHHMMKARQPCCWWMTFTKVSNPPLPPHPYVVDHETFVVEGGIHGDLARCLVWVRTFSQISGVRYCFPDI